MKPRQIEIMKDFAEVPLSKGRKAIIDLKDVPFVSKFNWSVGPGGYSQRGFRIKGKFFIQFLHRFLLKVPKGKFVDHINGDIYDNRRSNLRIVNRFQNGANRKKSISKSSIYKGVTFCKSRRNWRVSLCKGGIHYSFGSFFDEKEAAQKYNKEALHLFGKYAKINIVV